MQRNRKSTIAVAAAWFLLLFFIPAAHAQRRLEQLDRGMVALHQGNGNVFVGWRLLGTDPPNIAFNVYRRIGDAQVLKLNDRPISGATQFQDDAATLNTRISYFVRDVVAGNEGEECRPFEVLTAAPAKPYLSVPLHTSDGYRPNDASVGDLDGDGQYEIVLHQVGRGRDNSQAGFTTEPILEAYELDGTMLWRVNLGKNIREGAHYTQFMVYDFDGDGRAEMVCKTADGTTDGRGQVLGDRDADYRNTRGYVLDGPEYLTVFDGLTGAALASTEYVPPRGTVRDWGDDYGNRVDRFLACVAYLDGRRPSVVMCRGYYTRTVLVAWNWRGGALTRVWTFDSDDNVAALALAKSGVFVARAITGSAWPTSTKMGKMKSSMDRLSLTTTGPGSTRPATVMVTPCT